LKQRGLIRKRRMKMKMRRRISVPQTVSVKTQLMIARNGLGLHPRRA